MLLHRNKFGIAAALTCTTVARNSNAAARPLPNDNPHFGNAAAGWGGGGGGGVNVIPNTRVAVASRRFRDAALVKVALLPRQNRALVPSLKV